jgi:hypothetical protein
VRRHNWCRCVVRPHGLSTKEGFLFGANPLLYQYLALHPYMLQLYMLHATSTCYYYGSSYVVATGMPCTMQCV